MAAQRSHAAPGRRLNSPHTCWHSWNGGEPITTLCVLTTHCEWHSCSHESEGATWRCNAIGNGLRRWQPAGPTLQGETGLSGFPTYEKISQRDVQRLLEFFTMSNGSTTRCVFIDFEEIGYNTIMAH